MVLDARRAVARVIGLDGDPGRVTFAANATQALNTALAGVLGAGDAVVLTDFDHNAVVRPVEALRRRRGVEVRTVSGSPEGALDEEGFARAVDGARLVVLNAVSNVLGTRLPVERLAAVAGEAGALVLVDTAQSAGHVSVDLSSADLVAFTGHKGLLGPQGTGGLWVREGVQVSPLVHGGTGGNSLDPEMPGEFPDRLEAGTLNGPGLAGLLAAVDVVRSEGIEAIHLREAGLKERLREGMAGLPGVSVLSPAAPDGAGIVTLVSKRRDPAALAHALDQDFGVLARAGLHCAPGAHHLLGTTETGALRLSVGWGSTEEDVDRAVEAVAELTRNTLIPTG
jgi:selenocysteine lyase/cysteine desulfurase